MGEDHMASRELSPSASGTRAVGGAHTPGPWVVCESGLSTTPSYLVIEDVPGRLRPICAAEYEHPSAEANAYLIAAAPSLLSALQLCMSWIIELAESGDAGFWDAEDMPVVMAARMAIAKALAAATASPADRQGQVPGMNKKADQ